MACGRVVTDSKAGIILDSKLNSHVHLHKELTVLFSMHKKNLRKNSIKKNRINYICLQ